MDIYYVFVSHRVKSTLVKERKKGDGWS